MDYIESNCLAHEREFPPFDRVNELEQEQLFRPSNRSLRREGMQKEKNKLNEAGTSVSMSDINIEHRNSFARIKQIHELITGED